MKYIDLDFEDARLKKWETGKRKYRPLMRADRPISREEADSFVGDPLEELFQELLDAYSYVLVLENSGVEMPGFRTTFRNMALTLQARRRELLQIESLKLG